MPEVTPLLSTETEPSDAELVARCARRDRLAWTTLVRRYRRLVFAVPARAGLDPDAAEEIFQETFVRLAEQIRTIEHREKVRAWILTTARRLTIDAIRARATTRRLRESVVRLEELRPPETALPLDEIARLEDQHLVRRALARLDPRSRRLLHLLFYEADGESGYAAIAKELGMPIGSLGPTRARSLRKLRAEYEKLAAEPERSAVPVCA